ncbi:hypothetical protein KIH74_14510 [Kineosporia sp. J2-2]|uniref:Uncharacterized protein n=1 Tax=Kineosporia corallincola TaxID=2835133 RepID=A0ABS5TGD9_9ACTN|nr:hypothetical protein [Kineosporia corallincola]MBT0770149.1 hypothetical protein [Kineosporia corallincola]
MIRTDGGLPAMVRLISWLQKNLDGAIAFAVAVVVAVLDVFGLPGEGQVDNAILLVLGVLAVAQLRDRSRKEDSELATRALLDQTVGKLTGQVQSVQKKVDGVARDLTGVHQQVDGISLGVEGISRGVDDATMVRVLSGDEITRALRDARHHTERWHFRGGTGTYIRAVTLPDCVDQSRRERRSLEVRLEIIDPTNLELCSTYAQFRGSSPNDRDPWDPERTQREAYATILAAAWYLQRSSFLDIKVGLSQVMPTLRSDLSSSTLVITNERPFGQALLVQRDKLLYSYIETDLRKSFEQARPVPLEQARHPRLRDEPTPDEVVRFFARLDMPLSTSFLDDDVGDIIRRALHAEDPFAS